jgi:gamma-glutamyl hydrolase
VTVNYHVQCLTRTNFTESKLNEFFNILSTNKDRMDHNLTFISTMEAKKYPIYGVQWHPEKNQFEFVLNAKHQNTPHHYNAIIISQYMANFFVNESRRNNNRFPDILQESQALIYNYNPQYSGQKSGATFEQIYVFSSANSNLWCVSFNIILLMILALNYLWLNQWIEKQFLFI